MIDKASPEWPGVRKWLEEQIEARRTALESPGCNIKDADLLRGELRFARGILSTVEPKRQPATTAPASDLKAGY